MMNTEAIKAARKKTRENIEKLAAIRDAAQKSRHIKNTDALDTLLDICATTKYAKGVLPDNTEALSMWDRVVTSLIRMDRLEAAGLDPIAVIENAIEAASDRVMEELQGAGFYVGQSWANTELGSNQDSSELTIILTKDGTGVYNCMEAEGHWDPKADEHTNQLQPAELPLSVGQPVRVEIRDAYDDSLIEYGTWPSLSEFLSDWQ